MSFMIGLGQARPNYSNEGPSGCRVSFQPNSSTPDMTHLINWSQSSEDDQLSNFVLLIGWNKNLQWNSLDIPGLGSKWYLQLYQE